MDKAYIVANEQQEREVLEKLEHECLTWLWGSEPTEWIPSKESFGIIKFPYILVNMGYCVARCSIKHLTEYEEIVFDGRKEIKMSEKYVVSQEFIDELKEWKDTLDSNDDKCKPLVKYQDIGCLPEVVFEWLAYDEVVDEENNNRLIAIIRWVNGEDVFEVEKPKKWVVRSKHADLSGDYWYVYVYNMLASSRFNEAGATKFDTKEEAQSWANSHQEVIEVEE